MNTPEEAHAEANRPNRSRPLAFAAEAVIGLAIAVLLVWVAAAAVSDVPFVYQGL